MNEISNIVKISIVEIELEYLSLKDYKLIKKYPTNIVSIKARSNLKGEEYCEHDIKKFKKSLRKTSNLRMINF